MAIVLPQGRFNNASDKNIREFIAERCRILAVVGLHEMYLNLIQELKLQYYLFKNGMMSYVQK